MDIVHNNYHFNRLFLKMKVNVLKIVKLHKTNMFRKMKIRYVKNVIKHNIRNISQIRINMNVLIIANKVRLYLEIIIALKVIAINYLIFQINNIKIRINVYNNVKTSLLLLMKKTKQKIINNV